MKETEAEQFSRGLGREQAEDLIRAGLEGAGTAEAEVILVVQTQGVARYAGGMVHQHLVEENTLLSVRAITAQKQFGHATGNQLTVEAARAVGRRAGENARLALPVPDWRSLPGPELAPREEEDGLWDPETAQARPALRTEAVERVKRALAAAGMTGSGAATTEALVVAVGNSRGLRAFGRATRASLSVIATLEGDAEVSGYAEAASNSWRDLAVEALAVEARERCAAARSPRTLEPGRYDVVFEPYAVADLVAFTAYLGFGAQACQEGRSFLCGHVGEQLVDEAITLVDDGWDPAGLPFPFDFEGVARRRVSLFTGGVVGGPVYDTLTAAREGKTSTGHAQLPPSPEGPLPGHLLLAAGREGREELLGGLERGLLVTRLHYLGIVDPLAAVLTGTTRDGVYWVEGGRVKYAVRNLRFTENILAALRRVTGVGRERRCFPGELVGSTVVPALRLAGFNFGKELHEIGR